MAETNPTPESKDQTPPEARVIAQLSSARAGLGPDYGPVFAKFCEQILPRLALPLTSQKLIEDFANIDVTAEKIADNLARNPYYEYHMLKVVESVRKREDQPSIEAAVILLGMQNTRNLILALQAYRTVTGRHAEFTKEGKLVLVPSEIVKYALKAEEAASKDKSGYPDMAFAAGYLFDLVSLLANEFAEKNGGDKKKIAAFIDQQFTLSLKAAALANEIAKTVHDFGFKKHAFAAGMIRDIGKLALAILDPKYIDFFEDSAKRELPRGVRQFVEQERFGAPHAALSGLMAGCIHVFKPIMRGVLAHHDPFALRQQKALYQLALVLRLASNMAANFKKSDKADDPVLQLWKTIELKDLKIEGPALFAITKAMP